MTNIEFVAIDIIPDATIGTTDTIDATALYRGYTYDEIKDLILPSFCILPKKERKIEETEIIELPNIDEIWETIERSLS